MRSPDPSLLTGTVSEVVLERMRAVSERLRLAKVPHALIGGLAVGAWGFPRATKDVDFLVGPEAFAKLVPLVVLRSDISDMNRVGFVDLMASPVGREVLDQYVTIPQAGELPVLPVEALVLMKLDAWRVQDRTDVIRLLHASAVVPDDVVSFLDAHAPDLLPRFTELLQAAEQA